MNHPEIYDKFVVPPHLSKVRYQRDTKMQNAATIEIQREDHTVGDPVVMELHENPNVAFAAYKIPHPLEHRLLLKVRTNGTVAPQEAYNEALTSLMDQLKEIKSSFKTQVKDMSRTEDGMDFEPHTKYIQAYGDVSMEDGGGEYGFGPEQFDNNALGFDTGYGAAT